MNKSPPSLREGSLEAPTRHPLNWQDPEFYNEIPLFEELERVYDICHGCRRCVSLCPPLTEFVEVFHQIVQSRHIGVGLALLHIEDR